jgi:hypothetical protein
MTHIELAPLPDKIWAGNMLLAAGKGCCDM